MSAVQVLDGGVVKDPEVHAEVIASIKRGAEALGFKCCGVIESPITGATSGNKEFLAHFTQESWAFLAKHMLHVSICAAVFSWGHSIWKRHFETRRLAFSMIRMTSSHHAVNELTAGIQMRWMPCLCSLDCTSLCGWSWLHCMWEFEVWWRSTRTYESP